MKHKQYQSLITQLTQKATSLGATVRFEKNYVNDGFFDWNEMEIVINDNETMPNITIHNLAHEVRHLIQYKTGKFARCYDNRHFEILNAMLNGDELPQYDDYKLPCKRTDYLCELDAQRYATLYLLNNTGVIYNPHYPKEATNAYEFYDVAWQLDIDIRSIYA